VNRAPRGPLTGERRQAGGVPPQAMVTAIAYPVHRAPQGLSAHPLPGPDWIRSRV